MIVEETQVNCNQLVLKMVLMTYSPGVCKYVGMQVWSLALERLKVLKMSSEAGFL